MQKVTEKDPEMAARIMDLVQAGVRPDQIAQKLDEELSAKRLLEEEGPAPEEQFPEEILLIAQALAFSTPQEEDAMRICKLLNEAYIDETIGDEAFRKAAPVVEMEAMRVMPTPKTTSGWRWKCLMAVGWKRTGHSWAFPASRRMACRVAMARWKAP